MTLVSISENQLFRVLRSPVQRYQRLSVTARAVVGWCDRQIVSGTLFDLAIVRRQVLLLFTRKGIVMFWTRSADRLLVGCAAVHRPGSVCARGAGQGRGSV